jgi:hypothetical protein
MWKNGQASAAASAAAAVEELVQAQFHKYLKRVIQFFAHHPYWSVPDQSGNE